MGGVQLFFFQKKKELVETGGNCGESHSPSSIVAWASYKNEILTFRCDGSKDGDDGASR